MQLINSTLFLKTNFFLSYELLFALLVAFTSAAVLLGASKSFVSKCFFKNSKISCN